MPVSSSTTKSAAALKTISEVAEILELPQHVLRFWESKFPQIQPLKRRGGRRFYRPDDIALLETIRTLLHEKGYTIKGAQALLVKSSGRPKLVKAEEIPSAKSARAEEKPTAPRSRVSDDEKRAKLETVRKELVEMREILKKTA